MIAQPHVLEAARAPRPSLVHDLFALTKPRITSLVLLTTAGGFFLAPGHLSWPRLLVTLLATAAVVGAANTLNCYLEREVDAKMERTRNRPLPAHRLEPRVALLFGLLLAALSIPVLAFAANGPTALLALVALFSYVLLYTPLKQRSPKALVVGAIPGAMPPLLGWTAATGRPTLPGLVLFGILFLWQLPHFLAIALYRRDDYAAAGLKILPLVRGEATTRMHIVLYIVALVPMTLLLAPLGVAGARYEIAAALLGSAFFIGGCIGMREEIDVARWARGLFWGSLVYLTLLWTALMLDVVR